MKQSTHTQTQTHRIVSVFQHSVRQQALLHCIAARKPMGMDAWDCVTVAPADRELLSD